MTSVAATKKKLQKKKCTDNSDKEKTKKSYKAALTIKKKELEWSLKQSTNVAYHVEKGGIRFLRTSARGQKFC